MGSCSQNSSNIAGSKLINSISASGSRLITNILNHSSTNGGIVSGVTAGDVLRYDLIAGEPYLYRLSQADFPENSEVFGVVESVSDDNITVVMAGQIKYPMGAIRKIDPDAGGPLEADGAAGGEDIFFLSDSEAGKLQNLAPTDVGKIVKPIMQRADNGEYNGVVHNYIGYQLGGAVLAHAGDGEVSVGEVISFLGDISSLGKAYVDASKSYELKVLDYPRYYETMGTKYGYKCQVTIDTSSNLSFVSSSVKKKSAKQIYSTGSTYLSGQVEYISANVIEITVKSKTSSKKLFDTSKELIINNISYGVPTSVEVTYVFTPIITPSSAKYKVTNQSGESYSNDEVKIALKVRDDSALTVPKKLIIDELEILSKATISSTDINKKVIDVAKILNYIDADVTAYAEKFSTTSQTNTNAPVTDIS